MNLSISVDSAALQKAFAVAPLTISIHLTKWINESALKAEREAKQQVSDHVDTGTLQNSIHTTYGHLSATVKPTSKYAIFVEMGRRPGKFPPFGDGTPLNSWAKRRGIEPFLVARSIAKNGIKGDHFMEDAYRLTKPSIEADGQKLLSDVVRAI